MFKKLTFILLLCVPLQTLAFSDVEEGNPYYLPLNYLKTNNYINGYSDDTFKPFQDINRAESLALLTKAIPYKTYSPIEKPRANITKTSNSPVNNSECKFPDLKETDWFFNIFCNAYSNKVIEGYPDKKLHPEKTINKVEALKMAVLQSGLSLPTDNEDNFNDVTNLDWFKQYTQLAKANSFYVENRDGNLNPNETLNRGDFALLIYRIIKNKTESSKFGKASYYNTSLEGSYTSSGEKYQADLFTAAHKTLPLGTSVKVTNLANGKTVTVKINDRGPYTNSFVIDLSTTAFSSLAPLSTGIINIEYQIVP